MKCFRASVLDRCPSLLIFNKIDVVAHGARSDRNPMGVPGRVWLSAQTGDGVPALLEALSERLGQGVVEGAVWLMPHQGNLRAALFDVGLSLIHI